MRPLHQTIEQLGNSSFTMVLSRLVSGELVEDQDRGFRRDDKLRGWQDAGAKD